jgi:hypothetical protein
MKRWLDRLALAGMAAGLALYLVPWAGALKWGLFVTASFTVLHLFTSRGPR